MVLKRVLTGAICCTTLALWSGPSMAGEYRPDEFLGMDLSKAALSPKRLGPPTTFARVPVEAKSDPTGATSAHAELGSEPDANLKIAAPKSIMAHGRAVQPRSKVRAKLARRHHRNPLDAEARDTRIQVWPCKSGGICNWKPRAY
jgi:hypothetical protein